MANRSTAKKRVFIVFLTVLFLGLVAGNVYQYLENKDLNNELSLSENERKQKQNSKIYGEVSSLINLPAEEPLYVLVNDPEKAKEENPGIGTIFNDLKEGDYLLVFRRDRSAVQYRPVEKKIIKNSVVNFPIEIQLFGTEEQMNAIEAKLKDLGNQIRINKTVDSDVTGQFLYLSNSKLSSEASTIADLVGVQISSTIPSSITPSEQTEMVIVLAGASAQPATSQPVAE